MAASVVRVLLQSLDVLAAWPTLTANGGLTDVLVRTALAAPSAPADPGAPAASGSAGPSWTDQLSAVATAVAVLVAMFTLVVAVRAARYTKHQVDSARDQLAEARTLRREQAQPYVVMYAEPSAVDGLAIELVIKNYGTTAAYRVTPQLTPPLRRSNFLEGKRREVVDVLLPDVIPILAPGQEYRTLWDHGFHRKGLSLAQEHSGRVAYTDSTGEQHHSPVDLSWYQVSDTVLLVRYGPHHSAKALREINNTLKRWTSPRHALKVVTRDGDAYDARQRAAVQAWEEQDEQENQPDQDGHLTEATTGVGDGGDQVEQTRHGEAAAARRARMRQIRDIARRRPRTGQR